MFMLLISVHDQLTRLMRHNDRGVTAVEYGLIVFLIAAAIVGVLITLGTTLSGIFSNITADL